ncbi:hypothetical protein AOQ84DRAFT_71540 [Glonium stellatum]|uniref:Uncharacterized protein n=1 Tax=Glonium stellatum TaxID=574774 RepID=A0A8E2EXL7_9PEZI|nr:hypothetical protein AOQ84DRAFT_71540 [Glonium stellatum]
MNTKKNKVVTKRARSKPTIGLTSPTAQIVVYTRKQQPPTASPTSTMKTSTESPASMMETSTESPTSESAWHRRRNKWSARNRRGNIYKRVSSNGKARQLNGDIGVKGPGLFKSHKYDKIKAWGGSKQINGNLISEASRFFD